MKTIINDIKVCKFDPVVICERRKARKMKNAELVRLAKLLVTSFVKYDIVAMQKTNFLAAQLQAVKVCPLPDKRSKVFQDH